MKNKSMLKKITIWLLFALCMTFCFVACTDDKALQGSAKIVVVDATTNTKTEIEADFASAKMKNDNNLFDLLVWLEANNKIEFEYSNGAWGAYVTKIGTIEQHDNFSVSVYTSVESDFDTSAWVKEVTYGDKTLKTSGVGVSMMKLADNAVYYFCLLEY